MLIFLIPVYLDAELLLGHLSVHPKTEVKLPALEDE